MTPLQSALPCPLKLRILPQARRLSQGDPGLLFPREAVLRIQWTVCLTEVVLSRSVPISFQLSRTSLVAKGLFLEKAVKTEKARTAMKYSS
jgi:hypothetical protein